MSVGTIGSIPKRPVQVRSAFKQLAAHTVPTKWSLYRPLLKFAPRSDIRQWIRERFRKDQHLTSETLIRESLMFFHSALRDFETWQSTKASRIVHRYQSHASMFRRRELRKVTPAKLSRIKPVIKPAIIQPGVDRKPMLRLYPQPDWISAMIRKRRMVYERLERGQKELDGFLKDLKFETLEQDVNISRGEQFVVPEYVQDAKGAFGFKAYQRAAHRRAMTKVPSWMKQAVKRARQRRAHRTYSVQQGSSPEPKPKPQIRQKRNDCTQW